MPKAWKDMVAGIKKSLKGKINKRTGKPYSDSDIYAIAMAEYKKKYGHAPKREQLLKLIQEDNPEFLLLEYSVPIKPKIITEKSMSISGIAVDASVSRNNVRYIPEELKRAADSLKGVKILNTHKGDDIYNILGKVTDSFYDEDSSSIRFTADIMDEKAQELIKDGRVDSVSIGARCVDLPEDDEDSGIVTAKGIEFVELSLVPIEGVRNATIQQAISEKFSFLNQINENYKLNEETQKGEPIMEAQEINKLVEEKFSTLMGTMLKKQAEEKELQEKEDLKKEVAALKEQVKALQEQEAVPEAPAEEEVPAEEPEVPEEKEEAETEVGEPEEKAEEKAGQFIVERSRDGVAFWRMP